MLSNDYRMIVGVLGAGAGGVSAAVELALAGHTVRLWNRSDAALRPFCKAGGIHYEGVFGSGAIEPSVISTDLGAVLDGVDGALVCLPTLAHGALAEQLAQIGANTLPIVLNPGHTGGALEFREVFRQRGVSPPPIAEFSTLTYVARKPAPHTVRVTCAAGQVRVAALPGGEAALKLARRLYASALPAEDVIATGLANVNMVLHPPGAILGASWIEATGGDFTFYVQGLTDGVGRVLEALDRERRAVAAAFGHDLPSLFDEMQAIGTIEANAARDAGLVAAIRGGVANSRIKAPDTLAHRYYTEDFYYGIRPFLVFADLAGAKVPVARALMTLAEALHAERKPPEGRSARRMGIEGMCKESLLKELRQ